MRANQEITRNKNVNELKLCRALERLQAQPDLGLVTTIITQNIYVSLISCQRWKVYLILSGLGEYRAVLVLRENDDGTVKVVCELP